MWSAGICLLVVLLIEGAVSYGFAYLIFKDRKWNLEPLTKWGIFYRVCGVALLTANCVGVIGFLVVGTRATFPSYWSHLVVAALMGIVSFVAALKGILGRKNAYFRQNSGDVLQTSRAAASGAL